MIKIKNNLLRGKDSGLRQALLDPQLEAYLYDLGISLGNHEDCDYVFEMANELNINEILPNTIAFERIDGAQINNKELLPEKNLIRLVKMYHYDQGINNLECVDNRIFTRLLSEENEWEKRIYYISAEMFAKIRTGLSFWHWKSLDMTEMFSLGLNLRNSRDIDIFFAGTTEYGDGTHKSGNITTSHRKSLIQAINNLDVYNKVTSISRDKSKPDYLRLLHKTKIAVSPWGWGEACHRDYEAIICGCALIKPESFKIRSNPDIYNERFMYFCKPDWSNLQDVVYRVIDEYQEKQEQRIENSRYLLEQRTPQVQAKIIAGIVRDCG